MAEEEKPQAQPVEHTETKSPDGTEVKTDKPAPTGDEDDGDDD